jgi:nicotinate-nucleotide adenylyltransferase
MKIALFGGTFDPIHRGHLFICRQAKEQVGLDRVILLPCRQSPHKQVIPGATDPHRLEMARLATADLDWVEVSDWELRRPGASFSWQTIEHFLQQHPEAELFWIMGHDQWEVLEKWGRPEYLAAHLTFLVFARNGKHPQPNPPFRSMVLRGEMEVSATEIRNLLAQGRSAARLLPDAVQSYATKHKLYQTDVR